MEDLRESLELQIKLDSVNGDTTVLRHLLNKLDDNTIFHALSEDGQAEVISYYNVHVNIPSGGYSIGVMCKYPMDDQRVIDTAIEDDLFEDEDDYLYVDSVDEITKYEWEGV